MGRLDKVYFASVGALALWVGVWGMFLPAKVDHAIPWLVPPLHARFLGAMYLSGATFMAGCLMARRWAEVRVVTLMVAAWTGLLLIVSLLHLEEFDFARTPTWVWFVAYLVFPIGALWLAWTHRHIHDDEPGVPELPSWVATALLLVGMVATAVGALLFIAPGRATAAWPWKITPLLAQLYSAPFLAYGLGLIGLARESIWPNIRIAVAATLMFTTLVLVASTVHRALFALEGSDVLWFAGFALATTALASVALAGRRSARAAS